MSQTHHGLLIHVVFSTKLRYPLIKPHWQDELYAFVGGACREHKATLLCAGGVEDHVHLLLKVHPAFAIADTVRHLKANASRWVNNHRKVTARSEWQRGYGAFPVSQSMAGTVKDYIHRQKEHHQQQTFRDEYLQMLKRHQVNFDERYVFDEEVTA